MRNTFFKLVVIRTHSYIKNAFVIYYKTLHKMFKFSTEKNVRVQSFTKRLIFVDNLAKVMKYDSRVIIHYFLYFFFFIFIISSLTTKTFYQMDSGNFLLLAIYSGFFLLGNYYQSCIFIRNKSSSSIFSFKASVINFVRTIGGSLKGSKKFTVKSRLIRNRTLYNYVLYSHILCDLMKIYSIKNQSHFFGTLAEQHIKRINPFFLPTESGPNIIYLAKEITKIRYQDKINAIKKRFSI